MPRKDDFRGAQMHCVVCQNPIPPTRKADAITCSKECTKARRDWGRSRQDATECRYCQKPSTPEDRVLFNMWKKAMKSGATNEQFVAQVIETTRLVHENERLKRKIAELEPVQEVAQA